MDDSENKLPEVISFYNLTKGGADTVDELAAAYDIYRNSHRWPLELFFCFMNTAGMNSQIVHRENEGRVILKRKHFLTQLRIWIDQRPSESKNEKSKGTSK